MEVFLTQEIFAVSEWANGDGHTSISAEDERWQLVQRILVSRQFQKAPQLREILVYLCRRTLEEHPAAISEHEIGCNVLGRRPSFNPNEDNIVRVQVRHLRRKLDDYFTSDGAEEPLLLLIPKGSYVPHYETRSSPPPAPVETAPEAIAAPKSQHRRQMAALLCLVVVLSVAVAVLWRQREALKRSPAYAAERAQTADGLWSKVFAPGQDVTIVASDTCSVMLQDILDVDIPLTDYLSGAYPNKWISAVPDRRLRDALQLISRRRYTSLGDLSVVQKMIELGHRFSRTPRIRYARYLDAREFKAGNFVLIGSRRGIPWIQLFEPQLNFSMEEDHESHKFYFRNKSPLPGEQSSYGVTRDGKPTPESYADIALLPNLSGTGYVLLLSGVTMEMTEAAGELVTSLEFSPMLSKMLNSKAGSPPASYIEILLQARLVPGTTRGSKIICYRTLASPKPYPAT